MHAWSWGAPGSATGRGRVGAGPARFFRSLGRQAAQLGCVVVCAARACGFRTPCGTAGRRSGPRPAPPAAWAPPSVASAARRSWRTPAAQAGHRKGCGLGCSKGRKGGARGGAERCPTTACCGPPTRPQAENLEPEQGAWNRQQGGKCVQLTAARVTRQRQPRADHAPDAAKPAACHSRLLSAARWPSCPCI